MRDKVWDSESKFNFYVKFMQPYATAAKVTEKVNLRIFKIHRSYST